MILRGTCPSGDVPAGHRAAGLVISSSGLHWVALFSPWNQSVLMRGEREWCRPTLLSLEWGARSLHFSWSIHRRAIISRVSLASARSSPSRCLHPSCPAVRHYSTPVFNLKHTAGFKTSDFSHRLDTDQCWSSGGGSCYSVASTGFFQKSVVWLCSSSEFMVKQS